MNEGKVIISRKYFIHFKVKVDLNATMSSGCIKHYIKNPYKPFNNISYCQVDTMIQKIYNFIPMAR